MKWRYIGHENCKLQKSQIETSTRTSWWTVDWHNSWRTLNFKKFRYFLDFLLSKFRIFLSSIPYLKLSAETSNLLVVEQTARYSKHSTYVTVSTGNRRVVRMTDCFRNSTNSSLTFIDLMDIRWSWWISKLENINKYP